MINEVFAAQIDKPVIDIRTYTIQPRKLGQFLEVFDKFAMPVQIKHLGPPIGFYVSDIGAQNQVIHLWAYESLSDYDERRIARDNDPDWVPYVQNSVGLIQHQENRFVKKADLPALAQYHANAK